MQNDTMISSTPVTTWLERILDAVLVRRIVSDSVVTHKIFPNIPTTNLFIDLENVSLQGLASFYSSLTKNPLKIGLCLRSRKTIKLWKNYEVGLIDILNWHRLSSEYRKTL